MTTADSKRVLVVANETVGGKALIDAVKRHADAGPVHVRVICPQNQPKHGYVIHDDSVRASVENRLKMTLAQLRDVGIEATGEIVDPDPYTAVMDTVGHEPADEIVVSTHPETRSGWLRRDLVERLRQETGVPVEHVVVDLDRDREDVTRTLVVANQTVEGGTLAETLKAKAAEGPRNFVVVVPAGEDAAGAHDRLAHALRELEGQGLRAVGQVGHPDPFTAVQNALQFYPADEIIISTFPGSRSGWLRNDLIERVRGTTSKPVDHVVVEPSEVSADPAPVA